MYCSMLVLLVVFLLKSITNAQNSVCPQCSTLNGAQYVVNGYQTSGVSNPLAYFNSPSDFGNQLGQAIASRINEGYKSASPSRLTFGSYPFSSYGGQGYGGTQSYIIQPDSSQQAVSSYGNTGTGGYSSSYSSFPGYGSYGYGNGQVPSSGYSTFGNLGTTNYGNTFGSYGSGYGIPDPITTGGSSSGGSGGSCPYCFGNKGGYKTKRTKRAKRSMKN